MSSWSCLGDENVCDNFDDGCKWGGGSALKNIFNGV